MFAPSKRLESFFAMSYAEDTEVPVEKSRAEIERLLTRYGADRFMVGSDQRQAILAFSVRGKMVQFTLPLPDRNASQFKMTSHNPPRRRSESQAWAAWEQVCRSRWRALRLCIQAKLEAVEVGITTFESEFLAHFVVPGGGTVGDLVIPQLEEMQKLGQAPKFPLLGMGGGQ